LKECNIPLIAARSKRGLLVFVATNCGLVVLNPWAKVMLDVSTLKNH